MTTANILAVPAAEETAAVRIVEALAVSFLIALSAQARVYLPFTPVPVTGQTLAVLAGGALLGPSYGALAVLFYLAEGALGLPFFAGGVSGAPVFFGPTAGYLLGFIPGAALTGWLARRGFDRTPAKAAAAFALGSVVIFACGLLGLTLFVPANRLLVAGLLPFLPGDLVKIALAAGALPAWCRLKDRLER